MVMTVLAVMTVCYVIYRYVYCRVPLAGSIWLAQPDITLLYMHPLSLRYVPIGMTQSVWFPAYAGMTVRDASMTGFAIGCFDE